MILDAEKVFVAFAGRRQLGRGGLREVAVMAQAAQGEGPGPVLVFDDSTGEVVDLDLRGTAEELRARIEAGARESGEPLVAEEGARRPGRPRLGVVPREVTLLPRHWEWLGTQPGGASVALRRLVEEARRANQEKDRQRRAREAAYRFMATMAGNERGFEEAARALFAGNREGFAALVAGWPADVARHALVLAGRGFEAGGSEQGE